MSNIRCGSWDARRASLPSDPPDVVWGYYPTIIAGHIRMNVDRFDRTVPWCMMVPQSIFTVQPKIQIDGITT